MELNMILNLIIASYNYPFYPHLMEQWKRYMNRHPKIVSFFLVNDWTKFVGSEQEMSYKIENDYVYFNAPEIGIPGIYEKTVKAMKLFSQNKAFWNQVQFIVRTNLSSFYIWDRLVTDLDSRPKQRFVGGVINMTPEPPYISGCGIVLSKDVALLLMVNLHHPYKYVLDDDRVIAQILHENGIRLVSMPTFDLDISMWNHMNYDDIHPNTFHVRTRCGTDEFRLHYGTEMYKRLVDYYYGN